MCNAWSAIVKKNGDVLWKFGMDSHSDILKHFNIPDNESEPGRLKFARIEISPANGNYLKPNEWKFKLDESITPSWWKKSYQIFAETEHKKWKKQLNKILINKEIVMPFSIGPPKKVLKKHIALLGAWASVGDSVGASVRDSVWDSVGDSVGASVRASVRAYISSYFNLQKWKYVKHKKGVNPYQPGIDLWNKGLVPSFDGKVWRLHGHEGKIVFEIEKKEISHD